MVLSLHFQRFLVVNWLLTGCGWLVLPLLVNQKIINWSWLTGCSIGQLFALVAMIIFYVGLKWQIQLCSKLFFTITWTLKTIFYLLPFIIYYRFQQTITFWGVLLGVVLVMIANQLVSWFNLTASLRFKNRLQLPFSSASVKI